MTRRRLRPAHSPSRLAEIYGKPYDHTLWPDHVLRVSVTVALARWLVAHVGAETAADLACGDGAVLDGLADLIPPERRYYGDLVSGGRGLDVVGPIERTAHTAPTADLVFLTETVEHLDDPDLVLKLLRAKAKHLILSTPVGADGDQNPEHYWSWDRADVEAMLAAAGWVVDVYSEIDLRPGGGMYGFGLWMAQ